MEHPTRWNLLYWATALMMLVLLQNAWQTWQTVQPVPYSEFEQALAEDRVAEVRVSETTITGKLRYPDAQG
ncbi:MAG: ATP-dependent metallopeptidase FtsH/Yme1/Tma family protein, partial [Acidimicrobiia bacterium]